MSGEKKIDYNALIDKAMRGLVKEVLNNVQIAGTLPGNHHFYISFRTADSNVKLSSVLRKDYPEEMTIVLQHRFKDLVVDDTGFAVTLWFHGRDERVHVPFAAITTFADPIIPFSVQFGKHQAKAEAKPKSKPRSPKTESNVISLQKKRQERVSDF